MCHIEGRATARRSSNFPASGPSIPAVPWECSSSIAFAAYRSWSLDDLSFSPPPSSLGTPPISGPPEKRETDQKKSTHRQVRGTRKQREDPGPGVELPLSPPSSPTMVNYTSHENIDMSDDTSDDGLYHHSGPSNRIARFTRPLIDYVRNEWQMGTKYSHLPTSSSERPESPRWIQMITSIVTAPRFRRYVVVYLSLLISCFVGWKFVLSPRLEEHSALLRSLDPQAKDEVGGWFGSNALPTFDNIVQLRDLDPSYLPAEKAAGPNQLNERRLIMIGDVHGCKEECAYSLSFHPPFSIF